MNLAGNVINLTANGRNWTSNATDTARPCPRPHLAKYLRRFPLLASATLLCVSLLLASGCEQKPDKPAPAREAQPAAAAPPAPIWEFSDEMVALATQPAGVTTGTFLDRAPGTDLRVMSYNAYWDAIFPDVNAAAAARFQRLLKCIDPDILALQEIGGRETEPPRSQDHVAKLLNQIAPLPGGEWHVYKGGTNVIASRWPLSMTGRKLTPSSYRDPAYALVDLPDAQFAIDAYVLNNHFKCCGGDEEQRKRQTQADAVANWLHDACSIGGEVDLAPQTALLVVGDLNLVGGPQPLVTVLTGDIQDEATYGPDSPPDWDRTELADAHPLHNIAGPDDYTWRNDDSQYDPGRLDFVIYSDSVLEELQSFVLNTANLPDEVLAQAGLQKLDVTLDDVGRRFDHLPVVVDFAVIPPEAVPGDGED